ncbi:uncharacterized protein [Antedon mediterranea]|uniref:uncharacterized protein n=1 Tax=Antedon mediterranea TaxID=105859 RepID=UPI003AF44E25
MIYQAPKIKLQFKLRTTMSTGIYISSLLFILIIVVYLVEGNIGIFCDDLITADNINNDNDIIISVKHPELGEIQSYEKGELYLVTFQVLNAAIKLRSFVLVSTDEDRRLYFGDFSHPLPYDVFNVDDCGQQNTIRGLLTTIPVIRWSVPTQSHDTSYETPRCVLLRAKIETNISSYILSKRICQNVIYKHRLRRDVENVSFKTCSSGWHRFGSRCYSIFHKKQDFPTASDTCTSFNGSLAIVKYQNESSFINELIQMNSSLEDTYWIGASDVLYESDFIWTDGTETTFEDWFEGWPEHRYFGRQPNDDGYSDQDCVELRRQFVMPMKGYSFANRWQWNDIACATLNGFVCQIPWGGVETQESDLTFCNITVTGSSGFVTSPNYPQPHPNDVTCSTKIVVLPGHRVLLEFQHFILENERNCLYDFVQISDNTNNSKVYCGNYTEKEKLLTFVSETNFVDIRFVSDEWVNFSGFNVSYSSQEVTYKCDDPEWIPIQGKCVKIVDTPQLDWEAAALACYNIGHKGTLASIENRELQEFLQDKLAQDTQLTTTTHYWLSGTDRENEGVWKWKLGDHTTDVTYTNWFQGSSDSRAQPSNVINEDCMIMTTSLGNNSFESYWADELCRVEAGYICQKNAAEIEETLSYPTDIFIEDEYGVLTSPDFPENYLNNMNITWIFVTKPGNQIVLLFHTFDIEKQPECLYDYILLSDSVGKTKHCGNKAANTYRYNSKYNILNITFYSDYSISLRGFSLSYQIVPVCQDILYTSEDGSFQSPQTFENYLNNVDCWVNISVPLDKRVVLQFDAFDLNFDTNCQKDFIEIFLSSEYSDRICGNRTSELWKLNYVSYANDMLIRFRTDQLETSKGFRARYSSVSVSGQVIYYAEVAPNVTNITSLDYPNPFPSLTFQETSLLAPTGFHATLNFTEIDFGRGATSTSGCLTDVVSIIDFEQYGQEKVLATICDGLITNLKNFSFTSTYHKLAVRVLSGSVNEPLNAGVKASFRIIKSNEVWDPGILNPMVVKTACDASPCKNGAECIVDKSSYICSCTEDFTGIQCTEQKISYILTEPLWSGTLAIIGLLFLMLIAFRLKRRCNRVCNCGVEKEVESPFKSYEDNEPSAIFAKYASDNDPTADAFSSLIQRLKAGATAQAKSDSSEVKKPAPPPVTTAPAPVTKVQQQVPNGLVPPVPNGKLIETSSQRPNGSVPTNGGVMGGPWTTKTSGLLKVTADINIPFRATTNNSNRKAKFNLDTLKKKHSFSSIIVKDEMDIIQEDAL